jgi:hypothetical protein
MNGTRTGSVLRNTVWYAMFRIRDILKRIRILGPVHWVTDPAPDPGIFISGFRDANKKYLFLTKLFCSSFCRCIYNSLQSRVPDPRHSAGSVLPDPKSREVANRTISGFTLHLEHRALPRKPQYSQGCGCLSLRPRPLSLDIRAASGMHGFPGSSIQP